MKQPTGSGLSVAIVLEGVSSPSDPLDCGVSSAPSVGEAPLRLIGWSLADVF